MSTLEILHVCPSRSFSGLEQYAFQLAVDQKHKGKKVGFAVAPNTELWRRCENESIKTVACDPYRFLGTLSFWRELSKVLAINKNLAALHLHTTQELFHILGPALLADLRKSHLPKIILHTHIWINHRKKDLYHRALYSVVDEVWCASEPARKTLVENLPISSSKIRIIKYGRDIEKIRKGFLDRVSARQHLRLAETPLFLGTVSRIEESKGVREFIEAAVPIMERSQDIQLAIMGGPSPHDKAASQYAENLARRVGELPSDVKSRIHLLGEIPDSYRFLKAFDLYVLPSYEECFSLSLLDAQLAELPVVGTDSGGTPEVVREGSTGWLCKPRDVKSLTGALEKAIGEKKLWPEFARAGQERVVSEFNKERVLDLILAAYDK